MERSLKESSPLAGLAPLEELIHGIIGTAFVTGYTPVSCILVAPSGAGKSRTLIRFDGDYDYIVRADDLTSSGLFDILAADKENKLKYILIPDFNPVLSHKASVTSLLVANLLSVTQDGTVRIADGRQNKECKHDPLGILTSCTFDIFARHSRKWHELGITRRILPVHYTYCLQTIRTAQRLIREGKITSLIPPLVLSAYKKTVVGISQTYSVELEVLSERLALNLGQYVALRKGVRTPQQGLAILPMAPHIVLAAIAKGNCVRFGRRQITKDDVTMATEFVSFTDMVTRRQL